MEDKDEEQLTVLANKIKKENYDLIGLQEVNQLLASPPAELDDYFQATDEQEPVRQTNFLFCLTERLKELGCYYYWNWSYNHLGYDIYHEGVGLLSKTPFRVSSHLISKTSDPEDYHTRKIVVAKLGMDEKLIVVNGHFSWWQDEHQGFSQEWQALERLLSEKEDNLVIMGDFNNADKRSGEGYDLVIQSKLALKDAYTHASQRDEGNTVDGPIDGWDGNSCGLRIDYIFVSNSFNVADCRIVFNGKNEKKISDHYGVEATVD